MVDIPGAIRTIVAGGMGGVALWVAIFPADVVKSRVQVESTAGTVEPTFRSVIRQVFKEEGTVCHNYNSLPILAHALYRDFFFNYKNFKGKF